MSKANDAAAPLDLKEFFHVGPVDVSGARYYTSALGRQHFTPNIWPGVPPAFAPRRRPLITARWTSSSCSSCGWPRSPCGVDEAFFDDKVDRSIGTMRLNYYPAQSVAPVLRGSSGPALTPTMAGSRSWPVKTCPADFRS